MTTTLLIKNADLEQLAARILYGVASEEELARAPIEDVFAIKQDTGAVHYTGRASVVTKDSGPSGRSRQFVASDETCDRSGDIIVVAGWQFDDFEKNPVALWGHDSEAFPIGTVHSWQKTKRGGKPVLLESIDYFDAAANPAAEAILRMVDAKGLRAVSVGFIPIKSSRPETEQMRAEMGVGRFGVRYEKQAQLELSNCSIPCNPNAVRTEKSLGVEDELRDAVDRAVSSGLIARELADEMLRAAAAITPRRRSFALGAPEASSAAAPIEPATSAAPAESASAADAETKATSAADPELAKKSEVAEVLALVTRDREMLDSQDDRIEALEARVASLCAEIAVLRSTAAKQAPADPAVATRFENAEAFFGHAFGQVALALSSTGSSEV